MFEEPTSRRQRTVTLTIRLNEQSEKELKEEAADKKVTVNGLVSQILGKYLEWDRHIEKLDAVTIPADSLARLTSNVDEEALAKFGREIAESRMSLISVWYKQITPETVLKFLIFYLERNKTAKIAFSKDEKPQRIVGFHHGGRSTFFKHFIERMFELSGKKVVVDSQQNQFSFQFEAD